MYSLWGKLQYLASIRLVVCLNSAANRPLANNYQTSAWLPGGEGGELGGLGHLGTKRNKPAKKKKKMRDKEQGIGTGRETGCAQGDQVFIANFIELVKKTPASQAQKECTRLNFAFGNTTCIMSVYYVYCNLLWVHVHKYAPI